jgi:hypothetical protein
MSDYQPELGQFCFGQPYQQYEASELLISALEHIDSELKRIMWNIEQKEYFSPFENTGQYFVNNIFEVYAYSWDDTIDQPYNFRWNNHNFDVSWYKYLGRGTSTNRIITNDEVNQMLNECIEFLRKYEKENDGTSY